MVYNGCSTSVSHNWGCIKNNSPSLTMSLFFGDLFTVLYIKVITKLPNSEQSYKGKVKTHNYINRQNQSTTGKL
jgi:hypothetical protein